METLKKYLPELQNQQRTNTRSCKKCLDKVYGQLCFLFVHCIMFSASILSFVWILARFNGDRIPTWTLIVACMLLLLCSMDLIIHLTIIGIENLISHAGNVADFFLTVVANIYIVIGLITNHQSQMTCLSIGLSLMIAREFILLIWSLYNFYFLNLVYMAPLLPDKFPRRQRLFTLKEVDESKESSQSDG